MYTCSRCRNEFPSEMVIGSPNILNRDLCPICMVQILNKLFKNPVISNDFRTMEAEAKKHKASKRRQNMGGHMINPPMDCRYRHCANDGAEWVDLVACDTMCDGKCNRHKVFSFMTMDARIAELNQNGVIY